jgi:hypothetical protein
MNYFSTKGMIKVTARRGRRRYRLQVDDKEMREYWTLKEEALDRHLWRTGFEGRGMELPQG